MLKNLSIGSLGFSSGLPYILIFSTLGVWLADIGIDLSLIGFFAWIVLTYSLKFLWAPLIDNFSIPLLNRFGYRKSWILLSQLLIVLCLLLLSWTNPKDNLQLFAFIAFLVAELNQQGNLAASYQFGYRIAILISSSFALIFASDFGWSLTYQLMAFLMLVGVVGVLIQPEQLNTSLKKLTLKTSIIEPLKDFLSRFGIFLASFLLLIVATYRLTDIVMGPMASPFYLEKGYTLKEIGYVVKGSLLVLVTNLLFSVIALYEKDLYLLGLVVGADSLAAGVVGTANITFLTSLVSKQYTAVQYALLTSFMMLPGKLFSGFSGVLANYFKFEYGTEYGWMIFFIFTSLLTIPCLILLLLYARHSFQDD